MVKILNLTQHPRTNDQKDVIEPSNKDYIKEIITFENIPTYREMIERATKLVNIARHHDTDEVMIGGASFFIPVLERTMLSHGITVHYAVSHRRTEEKEVDGEIIKRSVFKHRGFVTVDPSTVKREGEKCTDCPTSLCVLCMNCHNDDCEKSSLCDYFQKIPE